jgi:uncharacterized protein (DUF2141 family)
MALEAVLRASVPSRRLSIAVTGWCRYAGALACLLIPRLSPLRAQMPAPSSHRCTLNVQVSGFRNSKGVIGAAVFASSAGWPEDDSKSLARGALPVNISGIDLTFHVPPGRYAMVVLHDENANHHLDRNLFRVPKEGFGFANNPRINFSAPSWKDAAIQVACPATDVNIRLVYK